MKRIICILLALTLVAALFTGCAKSEPPTTTPDAGAQQTPDAVEETTTPEPTPEPVDYLFAPGNYATDEKGWPTEAYTYDTPFCLTDEILTYWTVNWTPQILPAEGMDGIDFCIAEQEATGVDIEYIVVSSETRYENFSVLLAADDLPDLMNQADIFYPGTEIDAIEQGYFANIYDYKEYCPNYIYYILSNMDRDKNLYDQCFLDNTHISKFLGMNNEGGLDATIIAVRADWLDKLGVNKDDLDTIDEYTAVAERMRTELGATYPIALISDCLDSGSYLGCYDTYTTLSSTYINAFPSPHIEDGKVSFYFSDDNSRAFIEQLSEWVATEWAYNNPDGQIFGFLMCTYSTNFLAEHGLGDAAAPYSYPGGEKAIEYFDYWYQVEYDGAYEWPKGVTLTEEQSAAFMMYADIDTFICENVLAFVSGVKPMSEWDAYVEQLSGMGLEEAEAIYQEAYDAYLQRVADRDI